MRLFINSQTAKLLSLAFLYTLIFNTSLILLKIDRLILKDGFIGFLSSFLMSFFVLTLTFNALRWNRFIFLLGSFIITVLGSVCSYFSYFHKVFYNQTAIELALQAHGDEVFNFVNLTFVIWVVGLTWFMHSLAKHVVTHCSIKNIKISFLSTIVLSCVLFYDQDFLQEQFYPYHSAIPTIQTLSQQIGHHPSIDRFQDVEVLKKPTANTNPLLVVLVIGESARGDHFSINGYHRETTPRLAQMPNLINYGIARSCANCTHRSLSCLLTRATAENKQPSFNEASFIELYNKAGFDTIWLGNQGGFFSLAHSYMRMVYEAQTVVIPSRSFYKGSQLDTQMLSYLDDFMKDLKKDTLLVIHTRGSHYHYEGCYPQAFRKFEPICQKRPWSRDVNTCSLQEIINSYDNTILFTDYFLSEAISKIESKNSVLLYASDHGESLGENGIFLHGTHQVKEQYTIPFFVWVSKEYQTTFPAKIEALNNNRGQDISHDLIFHTMLGLGDLQTSLIDETMSLVSLRDE